MLANKRLVFTVTALGVYFLAIFLVHTYAGFYHQRILNLMMIYVILTVSLNLSNGVMGISSLGQIGFMAIGAYVAAILTLPPSLKQRWLTGLPHWLAATQLHLLPVLVVAGLLAAIVAFLVGVVILRLQGVFAAVATLGFLIIVKVIAENWMTVTRGGRGISALPAYTDLWWTGGVAAVTVMVARETASMSSAVVLSSTGATARRRSRHR